MHAHACMTHTHTPYSIPQVPYGWPFMSHTQPPPYSIPQVPYGWPFMLFPVIHYYKNSTEVDILASKSLGTHALVYKGDSSQMELLV